MKGKNAPGATGDEPEWPRRLLTASLILLPFVVIGLAYDILAAETPTPYTPVPPSATVVVTSTTEPTTARL